MSAVTGGRDALGEVTVLLELDGRLSSGVGVSTDILEASGKAYLRALSTALDNAVSEAERVLEEEAKRPPRPDGGGLHLARRRAADPLPGRCSCGGAGAARRTRVRRLRPADHRARAAVAPELSEGAARRCSCRRQGGRDLDAAAAQTGGRRPVALGGGRVIDTAKAIAGAGEGVCAASRPPCRAPR